jgi:hypothetical protein
MKSYSFFCNIFSDGLVDEYLEQLIDFLHSFYNDLFQLLNVWRDFYCTLHIRHRDFDALLSPFHVCNVDRAYGH